MVDASEPTVVRKGSRATRTGERTGRAYLTVLSGEAAGTVFSLGRSETVIGRGVQADLQLPDNEVSREHAKIVRDADGTAKLVDLESSNGTFVNGSKVSVEVLRDGDRVRFGRNTTLRFRYEYRESPDDRRLEDNLVDTAEEEGGGATPDGVRVSLDDVGRLEDAKGDPARTLEALQTMLAQKERELGSSDSSLAPVLDRTGAAMRAAGNPRDALDLHARALRMHEQHGKTPRGIVHSLVGVGQCQLDLEAPGEALEPLERALELMHTWRATVTQLAPVRFALARALTGSKQDGARAYVLACKAREGFAKGSPELQGLAEEVDAWISAAAKASEAE